MMKECDKWATTFDCDQYSMDSSVRTSKLCLLKSLYEIIYKNDMKCGTCTLLYHDHH